MYEVGDIVRVPLINPDALYIITHKCFLSDRVVYKVKNIASGYTCAGTYHEGMFEPTKVSILKNFLRSLT